MRYNTFPFTEAGVLARLEETQNSHTVGDFSRSFHVDPAEMRTMLVQLLKEGKIKTFAAQNHTHYSALSVRRYQAPVVDPNAVPGYMRPAMTAESARRAGTFWSLSDAVRR